MITIEHILHFAAAVVARATNTLHVSAALAYSLLLVLAARRHQSIRLRRAIFGQRMFTSDV